MFSAPVSTCCFFLRTLHDLFTTKTIKPPFISNPEPPGRVITGQQLRRPVCDAFHMRRPSPYSTVKLFERFFVNFMLNNKTQPQDSRRVLCACGVLDKFVGVWKLDACALSKVTLSIIPHNVLNNIICR